ncbi:MAG: RpiB/LacA/LacB family sugar-phosphate isomerase [Sedimentisphaerales bacterium]|jgi:ribose 5-phosphate isomerase B|nr:RpiB/LacA/LacB family sugar-phosphate isomerase [Sedimentisphaerales bacterium]
MRVVVGYDHRGRGRVDCVRAAIEQQGHECIALGPEEDHTADFPDFAHAAATKVAENDADTAILLGATGMEMDMSANKLKGIRAARCNDELDARTARFRFDANVLCLPAELLNETVLRRVVTVWLETDFGERERSQRRIRKIEAIEDGANPSSTPRRRH